MNKELPEDIVYFLKLISNRENWNHDQEWGPYGRIYITTWVGDEDLDDMADELLLRYEEDEH